MGRGWRCRRLPSPRCAGRCTERGVFSLAFPPVVPKRLIFAAPFVSLPGNRRRLSARNHAALPRVPSAQEAPPASGPRRPMRQSPRSGGSRSRFGGRAGPLRGSRQRGMVQKLPSQAGRTQEAGAEARLRLQLPGPAGRFALRLQCMWRGSRSDGVCVCARVCVSRRFYIQSPMRARAMSFGT